VLTIIDSHAHVDSRKFDADRADVLVRARAAGVRRLINVGADLEGSRSSVRMAAEEDDVYATVGLHPHEAGTVSDADWAAIEALVSERKVVGVGECGLDRGPWNKVPMELQERLLRRHVGLHRETGLPLVIHNRDTFPELFRILDDESAVGGPLRGVMHCFSGGPDEARRCLDLGFDISFSGVVTFKNAPELRDATRVVPLDRVHVETDCPYLTPAPHRGERNEPAYVMHTARRVAEEMGVPFADFECATEANTVRLFGLPPLPPAATPTTPAGKGHASTSCEEKTA
jgi:TatD DNase family protein